MDMVDLTRVFFAFGVVVMLIFAVAAIAKKLGLHNRLSGMQSTERRLKIVDVLAIDPRRRLVLIQRDGQEHLVLLGQQQDLLIESYEAKKTDA